MLTIIVLLIRLIKNRQKLINIAIGLLDILSTTILSNNFFKQVERSKYRKPLSALDSEEAIVILNGILKRD